MGLPALFLAVFFYLPILQVLARGFRDAEGGASLRAAVDLLKDPYILRLIRFTALQALGSSLLSTVIGVPMAYILARTEFPGRRLASALTMLPFVLPSITVALGFLLMFGTNGWLNQILRTAFGLELRVLHSLWAILLAHAFYNAPVVARMTQSAWEQMDPRLEESARSLGASPFRVWRDVTLPATISGIAGGAALAFIYSFMSFPIVLALGGARYATLEVEIFTNVMVLWDWETGAALAAIQAVISLGFVHLVLRLQDDPTSFAGRSSGGKRIPLFGRASAGRLLAWVFIAACVVFFWGPIASIALHALQSPGGGFSWVGFERIFSSRHSAFIGDSPAASIVASLYFGSIAAALALAAGTAFAYGVLWGRRRRTSAHGLRRRIGSRLGPLFARLYGRYFGPNFDWYLGRHLAGRRKRDLARQPGPRSSRRPGRRLGTGAILETLALAPIAVSSVALGLGALLAFARPPLSAIPAGWRVILIHAVLAFPFVVRSVRPVLASLDPALRDVARTLGAPPFRAFVGIELPLAAGGVFVAYALAFGLSVGEMSATSMLSRPGLVTMPVSVYRFLSARDFQSASAMALVLALVSGGVFVVVEWASRAVRRERTGGRAKNRAHAREANSPHAVAQIANAQGERVRNEP